MLLRDEVRKFKAWAEMCPVETRAAGWECDYDGWEGLRAAALALLSSGSPDHWSPADVDDLLYVIARDNEMENLIDQAANMPETFLRLAELSLKSSESDARWQFAARLGNLHAHKAQGETILLHLADDQNEYVARRALLALGELRSDATEALAERAWSTGLEYQRMAALTVLAQIGSIKLDDYIERAISDGRKYLAGRAMQLKRRPDAGE